MQPSPRCPIRVLIFAASLRSGSVNRRLADLAATVAAAGGAEVDHAHMREFDCPSYNGDVQDHEGFPAGAEELRRRLEAADAFILASPEYNFTMPGMLKNVVDWVSRYRPQPFKGKHALLISASPSMAGGNRGLWSLRVPLEHLGAHVYPDMFSLAQAYQAFDGDGGIVDATLSAWFANTITGFLDLVEAAKHYPAAKSQWVEFLGEQDAPATHRVQV